MDEEKSELWEKDKEEDDLINELKEEIEEGIEDSDLSYDSEELDDEEMMAEAKKLSKKENGIAFKPSNEKNSRENEFIGEVLKNDRVYFYITFLIILLF